MIGHLPRGLPKKLGFFAAVTSEGQTKRWDISHSSRPKFGKTSDPWRQIIAELLAKCSNWHEVSEWSFWLEKATVSAIKSCWHGILDNVAELLGIETLCTLHLQKKEDDMKWHETSRDSQKVSLKNPFQSVFPILLPCPTEVSIQKVPIKSHQPPRESVVDTASVSRWCEGNDTAGKCALQRNTLVANWLPEVFRRLTPDTSQKTRPRCPSTSTLSRNSSWE